MDLTVTPLVVAIFALFQVPITMLVGLRRAKTQIRYLYGDDETLLRRGRAHENFTENVPMVLLVMAAAEVSGAAPLLLWLGAAILLAGRLMHYYVTLTTGWGKLRSTSMTLTLLPMLGFAVLTLWSLI